jgi:hypothetical protein
MMAMVVERGRGLVRFIELRKGPSSIVWLTADVQNKRVGAGVHVLLT